MKVLYHHRHYPLAFLWSSLALDRGMDRASISEIKQSFVLYKAFSLFQIYQIEQVILMRMENQLDTSKLVRLRQEVYDKAKEAANSIAWIREKPLIPLPKNAIEFLDISLMDAVREANQKFGSKPGAKLRCLLCHKHEHMVKGHFWPHATLKDTSLSLSGKPTYLVKGPSEKHKKSEYKTSKGVVFYMLCRHCDNQVLSIEENYFAENIMKKMNKTEIQAIAYTESFYRFCLTMVFRGLILQRGLQKCTNFKKIYKVFSQCRNVLLNPCNLHADNLPQVAVFFTPLIDECCNAEKDEGENQANTAKDIDHSAEPDQCGKEKKDKSEISLDQPNAAKDIHHSAKSPCDLPPPLLSFFAKHENEPGVTDDAVIKYLERNGFSKLSFVPILATEPSINRKGYFLIVHWNVFSIVLLLEPVHFPLEYEQFRISPSGGKLNVPSNRDRLNLTPPGLKLFYRENAINCSSFLLEAPPKVTLQKINISLDENAVPLKIPLIGDVKKPLFVNLLPAGIVIDRQHSTVSLPAFHSILLHDTVHDVVSSCGATVLLAVDENIRPYAIIHYYNPNGAISLGFYVNSNNFKFKEVLPDKKPKQFMELVATGYNATYQFFRDLPSLLLSNLVGHHAGATAVGFGDLLLHYSR